MSAVKLSGVVCATILVLHFTLVIAGTSRLPGKVKRESDAIERLEDDGRKAESGDEVIYDQRQVNGETNIRLSIKNFQLQLPESQLERFQKSNMAQLIRNSVLRLLGIELSGVPEKDVTTSRPEQVSEEQEQQQPEDSSGQPLPDISAAMLQVNGNNLPAKFFLEISDFLMNTNDNDAVDDKRVETNHNHQQQLQQQMLHRPQQQSGQPLYATEEIKIERLENSSKTKNQTITISKLRQQLATLPANGSALETVQKENNQSSSASHNATASTDRFVQTKPIRLDTVVVQINQDQPKTLREKVVWRMPPTVAGQV